MRLEAVFDARASQPAAAGAGPVPNRARKVQGSIALHPAAAQLGEYEPSVIHEAHAAPHGANPVLIHKTQRGSRKAAMTKGGPVEITLDAEQKVTGLHIITSLQAADEFSEAAIQIVAGNVQAAVGPSAAKLAPT
jgi:hypothetical protein